MSTLEQTRLDLSCTSEDFQIECTNNHISHFSEATIFRESITKNAAN